MTTPIKHQKPMRVGRAAKVKISFENTRTLNRYRNDIDGLRAIAILAVVLYHAELSFLPVRGGFFGVDIFFVISGYVIYPQLAKSSITIKQIMDFFVRRIRRIFPALMVMLGISYIFFLGFLMPTELLEFNQHLISALAMISNFIFYNSEQVYGAISTLKVPLLHTWSLGVEEQFYIFLPICLWFSSIFFSNSSRLHILLIFFFLSLIYFFLYTSHSKQLVFYIFIFRVWEFLLGVFIHYLPDIKKFSVHKQIKNLVTTLVFACLIASLVLLNFDKHPGIWTICPVFLTVALIWLGDSNTLVQRLLCFRALSAIGLLSYSLYLWHYPTLAFIRRMYESPSDYHILSGILVSIAFAFASYKFVENPLRNSTLFPTRRLFVTVGLMSFALVATYTYTLKSGGIPQRLPKILSDKPIIMRPWNNLKQDGKTCFNKQDFCKWESPENKKTIALIGDSHMAALQTELVQQLRDDFNVTAMTQGGCWPVKNIELFVALGKRTTGCFPEYQNRRIKEIDENTIVIVGGVLHNYLSQPLYRDEAFVKKGIHQKVLIPEKSVIELYRETLEEIIDKSHMTIVIYPHPTNNFNPATKLLTANFPFPLYRDLQIPENFHISKQRFMDSTKSAFDFLEPFKHPKLRRVYPHKVFCETNGDKCLIVKNDALLYADPTHLSGHGSKLLTEQIIREVYNAN